jgi:DNA repair exonuclease SbcCD ATPase subunit
MRIKTVVGYNIKGRNITKEFAPLSVITGDNMTGKTAVLDAIRLAWNGTTLGVGKRAGDIFSLASADSMTAIVYFDDTSSIERTWTRKGDKVSGQVRNPQAIKVPPVLLDASEFFDMPVEARLALLFGRLNLGSEPIKLRVSKVLDRMTDTGAARELLMRKYPPAPSETFQAYLERVIEKLGDEAKEQNQTAKRHRETAAGMIEIQNREQATAPVYQEDEVVREKATAQTVLEELLADRGAIESRQKSRAPSLERREKLRKTIEDYEPAAAALSSYEQGVADWTAKLASYANKESVSVAQDRLGGVLNRQSEAKGAKTHAETVLRDLQNEYGAILTAECCPTCKTKKANWKAAATEAFEAKQTELTAALAQAEATMEAIEQERVSAQQALSAARELERAIRDTNRALEEQTAQLAKSQRAREFIEELTPELHDLEKAFPADAADKDAEEIAHIEDLISDARTVVASADAKLKAIEDARLDAKRLVEATGARDKAQALADAYKAGQDELQRIRDEFMAQAFKPLLDSVNRFAAGILKSPLEFRDNTIGRVHEEKGNWIPFSVFSGTETAIMLSGVQLALGSESPAKVAIVDELGRLDANRKRQLLRNVAKAIEDGVLDQFIGVDVSADPYQELITPKDLKVSPLTLSIIRA